RAAAQIGHEGIVRVLDYGNSTDGMSYLVMELLQGESFADMLDRQRSVEPVKAVQMVLPLLDALAVAHERGIIHRDLKPENFFLAQDAAGRVLPKVLDFGIAKADLTPGRLTRTGIVMGTPAFMAPEQVRGEEPLEPCSDLWSLTVSLYEMIAGKLPFADNDYAALLWAICNQAPASLAGQRGVDDELWAIIERGLSRDRSERWASARAYADALSGWLLRQGIQEDISGTVRRPGGQRRSSPSLESSSTSIVINARQGYETAEAPTERGSALEQSMSDLRLSAALRSTANTEAVPVAPPSEAISTSDLSVPGVSRESLASQSMQVPMATPRSRVGVFGAAALGAVLLMGAAWNFRSTPASADTNVVASSPVVPSSEPSAAPM
ncbi:MAG: serine/threonine protein kinase, partial [Myxococcales bacterium]